MLKYIFSLIVVFFSLQVKAQDTIKKKYPERYGLRVGIDLHRLAKSFYDDNYKGLEVEGAYRLTKKFYAAGELGNEEKTVDDDRFNFTSKGTYFKVGFDFNSYENWLDMENMIHIGLRYGLSSFSQQLNSYKIYDPTNLYGENIVSSNERFNGLNASWVEVVGGIKAKLFNNFYMGFSLRLNYLVSDKKPDNFDNLYIPGFNRTYDGKFGAGFNYTLSYFLPIYKKDKNKIKKTTNNE
ncbi:hypothetical protein FIA58_005580 [Flavobacterium jejuense]|uniref:Outer membrane protein beta-barrel domain-containing protein n=1 Tax=Flavobacterium jejuense TaxID=1544455 RepID=A0ABX0INH2_9FLAO|nr:DUF6048 family protein [Flavobacterium jejuense]NHN25146.1 hypothetical protein [Flavobacterium jejuense]